MNKPLDGVTIVEVATWVAAPSGAAILADLGADVIKVEAIGGDASRGMLRQARQASPHAVDHPFQADNRGKRSIAVALDKPEGAAVVHRLLESADVFLTNLLPRRQKRFGLDPAAAFVHNSTLVHATLTGYGTTGPEAERPGYDVTAFFGRSGLYESQIEGDNPPPMARTAQGDHTTGLALACSVLASLRLAESTGEGQIADVSLFATAVWTLASDYAAVLVDERQPSKRARHELISPLANRFPCGDGRWIVLNMPEPHWWPKFCTAVDREEFLDDVRFESVADRFHHMAELVPMIDEAFSHRSLAEWGELFDEAGLIWGPMQSLTETMRDPQAHALGLFPTIEHPHGTFRSIATPIRIVGADVGPQGRAPETGEHTLATLIGAGYSEEEISSMVAAGVVAQGTDLAD